MNIIDELAEVARTAQITGIDMQFVHKLDMRTVYAGLENKPEYRMLIDSLMAMYEDAVKRNVPRERALAVLLGTHEDMVRYVIVKSLTERLKKLGIDKVVEGNVALQYVDVMEKIRIATEAMQKLDDEYKKRLADKPIDQFRYGLMYAADRWGTPAEKRAVGTLVKKIVLPAKTNESSTA